MKLLKLSLYTTLIITFIYIIFNLNTSINSMSIVLTNFFKSLFPYLFMFLIINQLLIKTSLIDLLGYILQFILYPIFKLNARSCSLLLLSIINGFPSSVLYSSLMVKEKKMEKQSTHAIATLFFLPSFTFIFYLIRNHLDKRIFTFFIFSLYLPTLILLLLNRNKSDDNYIIFKEIKGNLITSYNNFNFLKDIKEIIVNSILTIINILGMISFYSLITLLIPNNLLKGLLEFSIPSLNILNSNYSNIIKSLLLLIILSFSSLSSISQASLYLEDINLSLISFIKKRIELVSLSLIIFNLCLYIFYR